MRWSKQFAAAGLCMALVFAVVSCGTEDPTPTAPLQADGSALASQSVEVEVASDKSQTITAWIEADEIDVDKYPVVIGAEVTQSGDSWTFSVTLSSPYDTPERYADAWRVLDADDNELGIRVLGHDHASEQPFTRSQSGIVIPDDVAVVFIEGRDQANGWSGQRFDMPIR